MTASTCPACQNTRHVCENHPDRPWGPMCCTEGESGLCVHGACGCGAGEPCTACCGPRARELGWAGCPPEGPYPPRGDGC